MTSTRILTRRRLGTTSAHHAPARRRRRTRGFVQVASSVAAERLHLNSFGHAYMWFGAALIAVLFYLALAAQVTQSSYDIARLQDQQRQLIAEQDQLRYQEVTLHAPAQVQQQAAQGGMQRALRHPDCRHRRALMWQKPGFPRTFAARDICAFKSKKAGLFAATLLARTASSLK